MTSRERQQQLNKTCSSKSTKWNHDPQYKPTNQSFVGAYELFSCRKFEVPVLNSENYVAIKTAVHFSNCHNLFL
jgi:hypothetical protein